jgi:Cyclic phosphodiesterase-like protein
MLLRTLITHWTHLFAQSHYSQTTLCLYASRRIFLFSSMILKRNAVPESSSLSSLTTSSFSSISSSSSAQYSLWLVPPDGGPFQSHMRQQIQHYSQTVPGASVAFEPHVTVVGGFACNVEDLDNVIHTLQQGLNGFGRVEMSLQQVEDEPQCYKVKGHAELAWSQALYLPVQDTSSSNDGKNFVALCRLTRKLLQLPSSTVDVDDKNERYLFAPPACEPHLSLCYAHHVPDNAFREARARLQTIMKKDSNNIGNGIKNNPRCSFMAETLALYKTDPASVEGVAQWTELALIDLVCHSSPVGEKQGKGTLTTTTIASTTTTSQ